MVKVYGYSKCSTVKKALKFLDDNNVKYEHIDNVANKLNVKEITKIYKESELDIKKFFNTSGMLYRELGLKDKLLNMEEEEKLELLSTDGMLVKRPIIITQKGTLTGFNESKLKELI